MGYGAHSKTVAQVDPTNPSFVSIGQDPSAPGALAGIGKTGTVTFSKPYMMFRVTLDTQKQSFICDANFSGAEIQCLSDAGGFFRKTNTGIGIYVFKSAGSNTISFRNNTGAANILQIIALDGRITSSTDWT